jgi:hypothetical protein
VSTTAGPLPPTVARAGRAAAGRLHRYVLAGALLLSVALVGGVIGALCAPSPRRAWQLEGPGLFTDQLSRSGRDLVAGGSGLWVERQGSDSWKPVGPFSGYNLVFDVTTTGSANRPGPLYVGATTGAWKAGSVEGTYRRLALPAASVRRIVVSPDHESQVWASSIDGFWRSDDAGGTWVREDSGVTQAADAWALTWSRGQLYGATADHVYRWTGQDWRAVSNEYHVVSLDRAEGHLWAASMGDGIWEQQADGAWRPANTGLTLRNATGEAMTMDANTMSPYCGLFGQPGPGAAGVHVVSVSANTDGPLYAGTMVDGIDRSTDGGIEWSPYAAGLAAHGVVWQILQTRGRLLAATDEGIFSVRTQT